MTNDYEASLNLLQPTLRMHADFPGTQAEILRRWEAQDIYRSILEERRDADRFILHDGPPYAAERVHVGIGMNKVLKDIVAKYRSMKDRLVPLVPGWDCHGLPIESEVLKELGASAQQLPAAQIRDRCRESALRYVKEQKDLFRLLGIFADWDRPYLTMNPAYEAGVLSVLLDLVAKNYVYRDMKALTWCETCRTTLADVEIEHTEGGEGGKCWRCKGALTIRTTKQWFVRIDHRSSPDAKSLREQALLAVELIQWTPPESRNRISAMLQERPDWCISRQRSWGVPLPSFICRDCGEATLDLAVIRHVRDLIARHGSDIWFEKDPTEIFPPNLHCPKCGRGNIDKGADILDVWFESGSSWQPVLTADHRLDCPADLVIEGNDQHRGWFQLSLLTSLASTGKVPMRSILTHGFVLDDARSHTGRSRATYASLEDALKRYPADLLRLFFAGSDTASDLDLPQNLKAIEARSDKLRNTFRFLLGHLKDYLPREHAVHLQDLVPTDLWALCALHSLISKVTDDYERYAFHSVVRRVHEFCENELSALYFNVVKDRLTCEAATAHSRRSVQTVLHSILIGLVKLLAPILSYTCEEVWELTPGHSICASVHLSRWPKADESMLRDKRSAEVVKTFDRLRLLRQALGPMLEKLRASGEIGDSVKALVKIHVSDGIESLLGDESLAGLRDFLMVAEVLPGATAAGLTAAKNLPGVSIGVEVARYATCVRCRRPEPTCGSLRDPDLCLRCAEVLRPRKLAAMRDQSYGSSVAPTVRPAELAAFLRHRDIRRVALLNEQGRCKALALHPASQEVTQLAELQPLADYVNSSPDFRDHAALLFGLGEHTDVLFGIGIHRLTYGTPLGGTREFAYPTVGDLMDNLLRLSWGMSVKNAIADLPHGGGKSIIDTCGLDLCIHREFRREIYRDFGQFTASLFGRYICAEDMNNTTADTREMLSACRHVMCLPQGVGGSGNPSRFTALAAWAAAKAGWQFVSGSCSFAGLTIALQGAGNVGRNIVACLIEADPGIAKLILADHDPEQIQVIRRILLRSGKEHLLEVVSSKDPADTAGTYVERKDEIGKAYVLFEPCDILITAAVGKVINAGNVQKLACRLILPIANNVYSDNDAIAHALHERAILDVVENNVNWGGALAAASELLGYDEDNVTEACLAAFDKTRLLLQKAQERGCPPWLILKEEATRRIFDDVHPAVKAARGFRFLGDVSQGFAAWITTKWLRRVVDVDPDHFAAHALGSASFLTGVRGE
jgi:isoleucyl-tRNA synthetase/glutamate dehydrogenase/leucine dehydrogenase